MSKAKRRSKGDGREPGAFIAIPCAVLDSAAYQGLSHPAKALLLEVARQFHGDDNGRMLLSQNYLAGRGWRSSDVINRAKQELLDAGLIFQTVRGGFPNRASWYAVTWQALDRNPDYDPGIGAFVRGSYRLKNAALTPSRGAEESPIAPAHGLGSPTAAPSRGAIRAPFPASPAPSRGDPLEMPSKARRFA